MNIYLELDGWYKFMDVPSNAVSSGAINVAQASVPDFIVPLKGHKPDINKIQQRRFFYSGEESGGIPIFRSMH
jgi:hypothetical protein